MRTYPERPFQFCNRTVRDRISARDSCQWHCVLLTLLQVTFTRLAQAPMEARHGGLLCRWQVKYFEAKTSLTGREEKLAEVSELIEKNLILVGCTAIEDKLQEGVPECIEHLANAGIRIWILTGDKQVSLTLHHTACCLASCANCLEHYPHAA